MSEEGISKISVEYIKDSIVFQVDGEFKESYDINELFEINETIITQEMARQSVKQARLATLLARAERYAAHAKHSMEIEYAAVDDIIRQELAETNEKVTEPLVKSLVQTDEQYIMAVREYNEADSVVKLLKNILNAMKTKGDMLISIGAQLRAEMSMTGMVIKDDYDRSVDSLRDTLRKTQV